MLAIGSRAPEFTLPDQDGRETSLTTLLNSGPLILYFYPKDFTPGCTKEACVVRDLFGELRQGGLNVAGVSPSPVDKHRDFRARYNLPFTLLTDDDKSVIKMYEVNGPLGFGVRRVTYLIDQARHIRDVVQADFRIDAHEDFMRKALMLSSGH
jgi:peroxiredoxin Q/BCP